VREDYRIYYLNMGTVVQDARDLLTHFKTNPTLEGSGEITIQVGSGFFDVNYSQAIYTQSLSLIY